MIVDIGPQTLERILSGMDGCETLVWNGPLGAFEFPPFDNSTNELGKCIAEHTRDSYMTSVVGGGDTVSALNKIGVTDDISFVSTAGGAFLSWMEGKSLPGVVALSG